MIVINIFSLNISASYLFFITLNLNINLSTYYTLFQRVKEMCIKGSFLLKGRGRGWVKVSQGDTGKELRNQLVYV